MKELKRDEWKKLKYEEQAQIKNTILELSKEVGDLQTAQCLGTCIKEAAMLDQKWTEGLKWIKTMYKNINSQDNGLVEVMLTMIVVVRSSVGFIESFQEESSFFFQGFCTVFISLVQRTTKMEEEETHRLLLGL